MARDDEEINRLLARGRTSGPERERILDRALGNTAKRRGGLTRWLAVALPATAVVLLFFLWPRSAFTPKGPPATTFLDVSCGDGAGATCRVGGTLLFHVGGATLGGALMAWADPANGGERIWYLPTGDGTAAAVSAAGSLQTLSRGVRLGPEHAPGRYVVHLVLARRALSRVEAVAPPAGDLLASSTVTVQVVQ
ncbi:MAG: hypothetical protein JWN44_2988 [Myxococcales bacterium]|nr:hypothetical protein [Myxococcales bacterium]